MSQNAKVIFDKTIGTLNQFQQKGMQSSSSNAEKTGTQSQDNESSKKKKRNKSGKQV